MRSLSFAAGHSHIAVRGEPGRIRARAATIRLPRVATGFERLLIELPVATAHAIERAEELGADEAALLRQLAQLGVLEERLEKPGERGRLTAVRPGLRPRPREVHGSLAMHPHVFLRPTQTGWVARRPGSATAIHLEDHTLLRPGPTRWEVDATDLAQQLLLDEGFLVAEEELDTIARGWEFHDALFHSVSTFGDAAEGVYGARQVVTNTGRRDPLRERADQETGPPVELAPAPAEPTSSFAEVLEARRSRRQFSAESVDIEQLGALLSMSLRARSLSPTGPSYRAYPSAGARNEMTAIVASTHSGGGLALYDHDQHRLLPLPDSESAAEQVIAVLCAPCGIEAPLPSVGLVLAADHQRMSDAYGSIAYANELRNVGAIYQTIALAATALGLAACPVGGGWDTLERSLLAHSLDGRVVVGGIVVGHPANGSVR